MQALPEVPAADARGASLQELAATHPARHWTGATAPPGPFTPGGAFAGWLAGAPGSVPAQVVSALRAAVWDAPGFVQADLSAVPEEQWKSAFLRLARLVGEPLAQDAAGTQLLDIVAADASHSMATTFHTDGAFSPVAPDAFGLLCLRAAAEGGDVELISAYALLEEVERHSPGACALLGEPVAFHAPHQIVSGEQALAAVPLAERGPRGDLVLRYLAPQIDRARLRPEQRRLLAHLDDALRVVAPVVVPLGRGRCVLANNRWILHNRTRFVFSRHTADVRHTVRVWLSSPPT